MTIPATAEHFPHSERWPVGRVVSLSLALVLIVAVAALSYRSQQELLRAGQLVDHTRQVLFQIERVMSVLKDTGGGMRAYLATRNEQMLETSNAAIAELPRAMATLRQLTAENPGQQRALDALQPIIDQRVAWVERLLELGRTQGEGVVTIAELQRGRDLLDTMRDILEAMAAQESDLDRVRSEAARQQARFVTIPLVAGTLLSLAIIVLLFAQMYREVGRRRSAEAALLQANVTLEDRVHERTRQLEASEHRYRNVVDLMQEAIWIHAEGTVVFANPAAARLFGASRADDLIGRSAMSWVHPDDRGQALARTRNLTTGPTAVPVTEMRLTRLDGKTRIAAIHAISFTQDGKMQVMASARDVTELREAEAQLHQAQKMESVGQLTGGVAHDFNNLLTVVIGGLDLALDRVPDNVRPTLEGALSAAERGAALVRQMLAFSRRQMLTPEPLSFNDLATDMRDLLQRTLGEDIEIVTIFHSQLWPAIADKSQVESALLNFSINARDAMPGGGKLTIETGNVHLDEDYVARNAEVAPGNYVMLAVTDTGSGMPPEVAERAFEPFFTTKSMGKGTGLGLSMIYGFAKQSGGHLKIYSEVGHGTTMRLYLPRHLGEAATANDVPGKSIVQPRGGETILVVEDDELVRGFTVAQLRDLGYRVLEAADGRQAQGILGGDEPIDLMFTDVVMPGGITGRQLGEAAKLRRPTLKILYTSGYTENSIVHQGKLDPGVDFLAKPFRKQDLAVKIRAMLDAS